MTSWKGVKVIQPDHKPEFEKVRAEAREEMDAANLSLSKTAREIGKGVSTTTLSKWLRAMYEGDVSEVTERVKLWIDTRREAARRDMRPAGLDRHVDLGVTEEVEAVLSHAQAARDVVLIHGRSGAGKSWAAARYCAHHTAAYMLTATGAIATLPGLLSRVAHAVGAGEKHPSGLAAETAAVQRLEGRGALLVVDEAHHLSPRLLDELRCIRDLAGCGLALIGGDDLWTALASSRRCDQIVGRIGVRLPLGLITEMDAIDLCAGVLGRRPAAAEAKLFLQTVKGAGGMHAVRRLLARSWTLARSQGRERITGDDVAAAVESEAA